MDYVPPSITLRKWQDEFIPRLIKHQEGSMRKPAEERQAFLLNAFPGAGKTYAQLVASAYMLRQGFVEFLVFVVPSDKLRTDFARDAKTFGLILHNKPNLKVNLEATDGIVLTYSQLNVQNVATLKLWAETRNLMVSADEIHHLGARNSWGQMFEDAFQLSTVRLLTTGTPFRSDGGRIPWTTVRGDQLILAGPGAYSYGYREALLEGEVVREVEFHSWDGTVGWRSPDGQTNYTHEINEDLGAAYPDMSTDEIRRLESARRRHCLEPHFRYTRDQLNKAHKRLIAIRNRHPWAGGLIVCDTREHADEVATLVREITNTKPAVIHGESDGYKDKLEAFQVDRTYHRTPWLISVGMVTEGVDIKHLRVCVYLCRKKAPLFWTQVLGRILRWEQGAGEEQTAEFFQYNDGYNSRTESRDPRTNAVNLRKYADNILEQLESVIRERPNTEPTRRPDPDFPPDDNVQPMRSEGLFASGEDNERLMNGESFNSNYLDRFRPQAEACNMNVTKYVAMLRKQNPESWKRDAEAANSSD
tara:strand:- start:3591 stop:5183 length:1593 start_codon:yes stop_codon:yes gene_type:complete